MMLKNVEVIVFDLDGTLCDLAVDWSSVTDENRHEKELASVDDIYLSKTNFDILNELRKSYKLAIFSRNLHITAETFIKESGGPEMFIVGRDDTQKIKPDPEGLRLISEHFETKRLIMVGDSWHDVQAARNFYIPSIVVVNPKQKFKPGQATYYINNLNDLI